MGVLIAIDDQLHKRFKANLETTQHWYTVLKSRKALVGDPEKGERWLLLWMGSDNKLGRLTTVLLEIRQSCTTFFDK